MALKRWIVNEIYCNRNLASRQSPMTTGTARCMRACKAMKVPSVHHHSTSSTDMRNAEIQAQMKTDCNPHHFIVQPKIARSNRHCEQPVSAVCYRCSQGSCSLSCLAEVRLNQRLIQLHIRSVPWRLLGWKWIRQTTELQ